MIGYASNTGSRRNLAHLRMAGWRLLLTPQVPKYRPGFLFGIDNGAWGAHCQKRPFDRGAFKQLVERYGALADWVVIPDIVEGGLKSFDFSMTWMQYLRPLKKVLLPLQDGMTPELVGPFLREYPAAGLFLGGSTDFKLREMYAWGAVAHAYSRHYHVGRVNSARRIQLAEESGAWSFDGTSATRYSCTLPRLELSRQQPRLFTPETQS